MLTRDMNADAMSIRKTELIFWADNVADDTVPVASIQADVGMYWDITLFGMNIRHTPIGVPEFGPHALRAGLDLAALGRFDFRRTGDMPQIIARYDRLRELAASTYRGRLAVTFPCFHRGPLDIFIQLRGYEGFLDDAAERPAELRAALELMVGERLRFARERQRYLREPALPSATFVASVLNKVTLAGSDEEQSGKVAALRNVAMRREACLVAQAIQRLLPTYDETFARLDRFLALARRVLYA